MSVSIRPAYRSGHVPHPPPAVVAPAALFAAVLIAVFGAAYQLQTCSTVSEAPRMVTPTVFAPAQAHAPAQLPAGSHSAQRAHGTAARTTA